MVGLIQDPRADSSGTAVGVGSQGVGVCQEYSRVLASSKTMEAYRKGTQPRQGGPRKTWGEGGEDGRREGGEKGGRGSGNWTIASVDLSHTG